MHVRGLILSLDNSEKKMHCISESGILSVQIQRVVTKLGRVIRLRKIIWKYSVFVSIYVTQIRSKQTSLFVSHSKLIPLLKSCNVKYCQIMGILGRFCSFLTQFDMFLHYLTWTNKKSNNYLFWINFSYLNQIIYSF